MAAPRQLAFPVKLTSAGHLATVEQDSDDDIAGCIAVCLLYERGTRRGRPGFGVPSMIFEQGGPNLPALRAALVTDENESRAAYSPTLGEPFLRQAIARLQVGYDSEQGA